MDVQVGRMWTSHRDSITVSGCSQLINLVRVQAEGLVPFYKFHLSKEDYYVEEVYNTYTYYL